MPRSKLALATNGASSSTIGGEYLPPIPSHRRGSSVLESTINGDSRGGSVKNSGNFLQRWLGRSARNLHLMGSDKQGKKLQKGLRSKSEPNLNPKHSNAVLLDLDDFTTPPTTNSNPSDQSEIEILIKKHTNIFKFNSKVCPGLRSNQFFTNTHLRLSCSQ